METFRKILSKAGWLVALILGVILYVTQYVDENPAPVADTQVEVPAE